jgi:lipopolysaccharide exporter
VGLKRVAASAVQWNIASSGIIFAVQFAQLTVLARLLLPRDFGLAATVMVILGFIQAYADMGISNAIIHRQDTTADQLHSLYWLNVFSGMIVFVLLLAAIPVIVMFYDEPRLRSLMFCGALILLISPWGQQFQILLQKELKFKVLAFIEAASVLAGFAISTTAAILGLGALSLVLGQLGVSACAVLLLLIVGRKRWRPAAHFAIVDLEGYLAFGLYQMGARTVNLIAARLDQFFISLFLGPVALGYYSMAWGLTIQPMYRINAVLTRVTFPVFASIQVDTPRLKRGYMFVMWILSTVNSPIMLGLIVVAPRLVPLVLGAKWALAVSTIQVLAIAGWLRTMGNPIGALLLAKGRADLDFKWDVAVALIQAPVLYVVGRYGSLESVAIAVVLLAGINLAAMYVLLSRWLIGPCLSEYSRVLLTPLLLAALMAASIFAVSHVAPLLSSLVLVTIQIALGILVYGTLSFLIQRPKWSEVVAISRR